MGKHPILAADELERDKVCEEIYDQLYELKVRQSTHLRPPRPRRLKRIALYRRIVGCGHERILEIGCGRGDLTYSLATHANAVTGIDVSGKALEIANALRPSHGCQNVEFQRMTATELKFADESFDWALSTSVIEHLHPNDVRRHLEEVWRVLKPEGRYLTWCPNALGHHDDRDFHLSEFSYRQLTKELSATGFDQFLSYPFNRFAVGIDARWKIRLEEFLARYHIPILWSHLGVRNILLVSTKRSIRASLSERGAEPS